MFPFVINTKTIIRFCYFAEWKDGNEILDIFEVATPRVFNSYFQTSNQCFHSFYFGTELARRPKSILTMNH